MFDDRMIIDGLKLLDDEVLKGLKTFCELDKEISLAHGTWEDIINSRLYLAYVNIEITLRSIDKKECKI